VLGIVSAKGKENISSLLIDSQPSCMKTPRISTLRTSSKDCYTENICWRCVRGLRYLNINLISFKCFKVLFIAPGAANEDIVSLHSNSALSKFKITKITVPMIVYTAVQVCSNWLVQLVRVWLRIRLGSHSPPAKDGTRQKLGSNTKNLLIPYCKFARSNWSGQSPLWIGGMSKSFWSARTQGWLHITQKNIQEEGRSAVQLYT